MKYISDTNLETVWSVQPASGMDYKWFRSEAAAQKFYDDCVAEVEAEFDRFMGGSGSSAVIQSNLESDLEGGCYQSFTVAPHALPTYPEKHEPGSLSGMHPISGVKYGNLALVRP